MLAREGELIFVVSQRWRFFANSLAWTVGFFSCHARANDTAWHQRPPLFCSRSERNVRLLAWRVAIRPLPKTQQFQRSQQYRRLNVEKGAFFNSYRLNRIDGQL